ncbi:hypothetical protein KIN20_018948 [Parelaphostrongylus tenuis]|uniref:Uncharacterized protein n=1 Tax=Parelaphostrongylus tenuis TaxID=148309 RepID=A0AAD5N2K7_PARTN|nr:hypothetical protein KIN20_018948 [Parelaphostrongylus tenuis]
MAEEDTIEERTAKPKEQRGEPLDVDFTQRVDSVETGGRQDGEPLDMEMTQPVDVLDTVPHEVCYDHMTRGA